MTEMTEIRARITVPDLPCDDEQQWEPFADALERDHGEFGPILAWERDDLVTVLSMDATDRAHAAQVLVSAVIDSLRRAGLGDRYPTAIELEEVAELKPAAIT